MYMNNTWGEGETGTQGQEGYQEARASREENYECRKVGWMMVVYTKTRDGMKEHRMKSQNKRAFHSWDVKVDGCG